MLGKLTLNPGLYLDEPPLSVETWFAAGSNVRFYRGRAENIGGWSKLSETMLEGKARGMASWTSNIGGVFLAAGTHLRLYALAEEVIRNITPFRDQGTLTNPFTTTAASGVVVVADTSHGVNVGDAVTFTGGTAVGGITISGEYRVDSLIDGSSFRIIHPITATSSATGGGTVNFFYEISIGQEYGALFFGYGVGGYGLGTYGTSRSQAFLLAPRTWSLTQWGEYLMASPRDGALYQWDLSINARATKVTNSPAQIASFFVTPERFVVLLGTNEQISTTYNPLLVRWSSQGDNTVWDASVTNTAGEYQLSLGSRIVGGTASRLQNLIWTDTSLYSMQYRGDIEFVFGFDLLGTNCGLAGANAFAEKDGIAYWITPNGHFYVYDGSAPRALDCPVRRYIYDRIARQQMQTIFCGVNAHFSEVWWWYASGSSPEIDSFVGYNYADHAWFIGTIARTAWIDKANFGGPLGIGPDGYIYIHDLTVNGDGQPISAFIESAPFDMADGDATVNLRRIVPDMTLSGGPVAFTIRTKRFPAAQVEQTLTREFLPGMTRLDLRAQGRQMSMRVSSDTLGVSWRIGDIRVDVTPAGPR